MSWLTRILGVRQGDPAPLPEVEHEGFHILPAPQRTAEGWRIAARIRKEIGGEMRTHELIRADVIREEEAAREASLAKARQMIDQQGEALFR